MAEGSYPELVGIVGIDNDFADLAGVFEADVGPGGSGIGGLVDAIAEGNCGAHVGLAGADVDHARVGGGDGDGSDGGDAMAVGQVVEDGLPDDAAVGGFPDASADGAEVESVGVAGDTGDGEDAAAAEGSDEAPVEVVEELGREGLGEAAGEGRDGDEEAVLAGFGCLGVI